jgi:hypothetical protein
MGNGGLVDGLSQLAARWSPCRPLVVSLTRMKPQSPVESVFHPHRQVLWPGGLDMMVVDCCCSPLLSSLHLVSCLVSLGCFLCSSLHLPFGCSELFSFLSSSQTHCHLELASIHVGITRLKTSPTLLLSFLFFNEAGALVIAIFIFTYSFIVFIFFSLFRIFYRLPLPSDRPNYSPGGIVFIEK